LNELWVSDMQRDPFALLDAKTRAWAEPAVNKLGRRFVMTDYEGAEVTKCRDVSGKRCTGG
jgi:hypothetical protein